MYCAGRSTVLVLAVFTGSYAYSQLQAPVAAPAITGQSTRLSTWANDKSSGRARQGRMGSKDSVRTYDAHKRLVKVMEPGPDGQLTVETDYQWSDTGKLLQVVQHGSNDDAERVRTFKYDSQDRLIYETSPEGGTNTYTYDNKYMLTKTNARGIITTYTHDSNGNLVKKKYSNGDPSAIYVYDDSGKMTESYLETVKGRLAEKTYHYNEQGKLDSVTQKIDVKHKVSFTYDSEGNVASITYPDGYVVRQSWGSNGHIESIENQTGTSILSGAQYNSDNNLIYAKFGNTMAANIEYVDTDNIYSLKISKNGDNIQYKKYSYTADGSVSQIDDLLRPENGFTYTYDSLQRVIGYKSADEHYKQVYGYDAFGNMCTSSPCIYSAYNQLFEKQKIRYDASGDMTSDGRHSYSYDAEGRIINVDSGSTKYLYSAEGYRIQKQSGKNLAEEIWVGNQLLAEMQQDKTWTDYVYAEGRRVAAIRDSKATYYVSDPLGIMRMELSASGEILAQSAMTPYGVPLKRQSDAEEIPFTGGEQYDPETDLYSYLYRSYNPLIGRWMSPDPSNEKYATLRNPQTLNLYSYVINDPLKYIDDLGLSSNTFSCERLLDFLESIRDGVKNAVDAYNYAKQIANARYWVNAARVDNALRCNADYMINADNDATLVNARYMMEYAKASQSVISFAYDIYQSVMTAEVPDKVFNALYADVVSNTLNVATSYATTSINDSVNTATQNYLSALSAHIATYHDNGDPPTGK
ncbi:RHS repeat domain-containing protein (plasmid) [Telmatobacter bradus]|uniref:RHS repeat domain-containing protein n=1 Tax=Telmatobacter bradus TaxID=474953 RepID=UPI003B42A211